jgi:phosphate acyltransferase
MRLALDAMGGDHAPEVCVRGALEAVREHGLEVTLVGDEAALAPELDEAGEIPPGLHVHHASQVVEMEDHPSIALRRKKDSSLRVACELVRSGEADALISAGNSGAALAMGMFVLKRVPGVVRPAIAAVFPTTHGPVALLDAGANVECKPEMLRQFAVMGAAFSEVCLGVERPRVGLLSNGEEDEKGTDLTRAAHPLIRELPLDYRGYVEGREVFRGAVDVVVTDGFTGNVVLKVAEGVIEQVGAQLRKSARATLPSMLGALLMRGAFRRTKETIEYSEIGGALLLGVQGCVVITHGRADARAMTNALRFGARVVGEGLDARLREHLAAANGP